MKKAKIKLINNLVSALFLINFSTITYSSNNNFVSYEGQYRLRFENLHNTYRADSQGSDQILASRLLLSAKANSDNLFGEIEIQDSRTWLDDEGTPLGTDDVNTLEPLQAWLGWRNGEKNFLKVGRLSFDIGSRRLMARQRFRNTLTSFDGIHGQIEHNNWLWQAFYLRAVDRLPNDRNELDTNTQKIDKRSDNKFWGLHLSNSLDTKFEAYIYKLQNDNLENLNTVGFRVVKLPPVKQWGYEIESAYQFGENQNEDHGAALFHGQIGYQFDDALSSRVDLIGDYASGDKNINDSQSNRFNTLFGVTRFDFGPTGIYGAFARANVISPGLAWNFKPFNNGNAFFIYRALWLDSPSDLQSRSSIQDSSGNSGRFLGQQIETRWRLEMHEDIQLELGGAYLIKGEYLNDAPNAPDESNTTYIYTSMSYHF